MIHNTIGGWQHGSYILKFLDFGTDSTHKIGLKGED